MFNREQFKRELIAGPDGRQRYSYEVEIGGIPQEHLHELLVAKKRAVTADIVSALPSYRTWRVRIEEREYTNPSYVLGVPSLVWRMDFFIDEIEERPLFETYYPPAPLVLLSGKSGIWQGFVDWIRERLNQ